MSDREWIEQYMDANGGKYIQANDDIWAYAELAFKEVKSAARLEQMLRDEGFAVETGVAGIPPALPGTWSQGSGKPVMGILGEYDALAALSQEAGSAVKRETVPGGAGHGCGHCALGTGSLAAAVAVKEYLRETGRDGTRHLFRLSGGGRGWLQAVYGPGRGV